MSNQPRKIIYLNDPRIWLAVLLLWAGAMHWLLYPVKVVLAHAMGALDRGMFCTSLQIGFTTISFILDAFGAYLISHFIIGVLRQRYSDANNKTIIKMGEIFRPNMKRILYALVITVILSFLSEEMLQALIADWLNIEELINASLTSSIILHPIYVVVAYLIASLLTYFLEKQCKKHQKSNAHSAT